ncbi:quinolinate synthase NadA [Roseospira marina]|uniref:Quinolinate synthase n=2 Tax=Roseospira marina TaxID=140057 RepID=A0A5M6I469_9PROT|nr:quinolinate synthase NadA [Roseospira marina]KAA5603016.1 quinolinate synthase NadA [Roseospira marina]
MPGPAPTLLPCSRDAEARVADVYARIKDVIPPMEWPGYAPEIDAIRALKRERNAVVLAHNYQAPEIFHGVADIQGDSLALARQAADCDADVLVVAGVHFMAETAKLVNPDKTVLIPDLRAGCSLAESITAEDVRALRAAHPGVPVVTYVNTSAAVKAESDICCTSGNAVAVVESLGVPRVIVLPDGYLAHHVARNTAVEVIPWTGTCEVHARFTGAEVETFRARFPSLTVLAHPECPPDVLDAADHVGSTAQMIAYVRRERPERVFLVTECSMSDNIAAELPDVAFVKPCTVCPHMKRITLPRIRHALEMLAPRVELDPDIAERARRPVERMLAVG